jgi:cobalamin biosynthesis protein CobT
MKFVNPIKQHLERVLLVKENKKMIPERERGMLNNRTLANLCIDKNYRTPFRQFTKIDTTNVAVSLVIDCSGSMGGNKIEVARQSGLALGESLKALDITFEIVGFNTKSSSGMYRLTAGLSSTETARFNRFGEALNHMIFKSYDSNDLSGICRAEAGGCNADGESLTWAAKRLAERKEKRKIMLVLSDGQPSYGGANHEVLAGDLKRVINLMPKAGIEPIGIGICTDDPKLFYKDYVVVNDISKLATTVVSKLAGLLEEGYKR